MVRFVMEILHIVNNPHIEQIVEAEKSASFPMYAANTEKRKNLLASCIICKYVILYYQDKEKELYQRTITE